MKDLKTLAALVIMLLCCTTASAYDFEVNGIFYTITSTTDLTVGVTSGDDNEYDYRGNVVIPSEVVYGDKTYRVTSIEQFGFAWARMTGLTIPNSIVRIGSSAFIDCYNLGAVYITNLEHWFEIDFEGNSSYGANPLVVSISQELY